MVSDMKHIHFLVMLIHFLKLFVTDMKQIHFLDKISKLCVYALLYTPDPLLEVARWCRRGKYKKQKTNKKKQKQKQKKKKNKQKKQKKQQQQLITSNCIKKVGFLDERVWGQVILLRIFMYKLPF